MLPADTERLSPRTELLASTVEALTGDECVVSGSFCSQNGLLDRDAVQGELGRSARFIELRLLSTATALEAAVVAEDLPTNERKLLLALPAVAFQYLDIEDPEERYEMLAGLAHESLPFLWVLSREKVGANFDKYHEMDVLWNAISPEVRAYFFRFFDALNALIVSDLLYTPASVAQMPVDVQDRLFESLAFSLKSLVCLGESGREQLVVRKYIELLEQERSLRCDPHHHFMYLLVKGFPRMPRS